MLLFFFNVFILLQMKKDVKKKTVESSSVIKTQILISLLHVLFLHFILDEGRLEVVEVLEFRKFYQFKYKILISICI